MTLTFDERVPPWECGERRAGSRMSGRRNRIQLFPCSLHGILKTDDVKDVLCLICVLLTESRK